MTKSWEDILRQAAGMDGYSAAGFVAPKMSTARATEARQPIGEAIARSGRPPSNQEAETVNDATDLARSGAETLLRAQGGDEARRLADLGGKLGRLNTLLSGGLAFAEIKALVDRGMPLDIATVRVFGGKVPGAVAGVVGGVAGTAVAGPAGTVAGGAAAGYLVDQAFGDDAADFSEGAYRRVRDGAQSLRRDILRSLDNVARPRAPDANGRYW